MAALIEIARRQDEPRISAERKERILREVLARAEAQRERRRIFRAFAAGAFAVLLAGLLFRLI